MRSGDPKPSSQKFGMSPQEIQERMDSEREDLINARRSRQESGPDKKARIIVAAALTGAGLIGFFTFGGSAAISSLFGNDGPVQKTSEVDLNVDRDREERTRLDFVVPANPVVEPKREDPNAALNDKLKALQSQLAEINRTKQAGVSNKEIQQMLARYNQTINEKLETERKAMAEENARLREEAALAEKERRRLEEEARLAASEMKDRQAQEKSRRESNAVVVDETRGSTVSGGSPTDAAFPDDLNINERFMKSAGSSIVQTSVANRLADPSRMIVQGTIVSAVLETAIDTQLPGNLRAQVMEPVFSFDGSRILMPQGTILIGQFNNNVDLAQKRVLIAWNRAITPDGQSIALGSSGTDRLGRAGTLGNVDNRYMLKFSAAAVSSAITVAPAMISRSIAGKDENNSGTTINIGGSGSSGGSGQDVAEAASNAFGGQATKAVDKYLDLPPIIRIPQGEEIRIFINRDLVFK
jgi:type IV secretion system protein VirB10